MRWQHCLDHADNIQKLAKSPDYLFGKVMQPNDSRLSETTSTLGLIADVAGFFVGGTPGGI